jgi:hypothetical protein
VNVAKTANAYVMMGLIRQITVCTNYAQEMVALAMANACRDAVYAAQASPVRIAP